MTAQTLEPVLLEPALELLEKRRSVSANKLGEPGPSNAQLDRILRIAARVPDHRKLAPWRFIVFTGDARARFGIVLAEICKREEKVAPSTMRLETEAARFLRAPAVVAVISSPRQDTKATPEWEQVLSAGAVCQNLVVSANASGFSTCWITEWYAYSPGVAQALELNAGERVAGFIYIGTAQETPEERERPVMDTIVRRW
jgi:nitroreductase